MAFLPLPAEAKSLARVIHKFQRDTGNRKTFHIESTLQKLVDRIVATEPINSFLLDVFKKKIKAAAFSSSRFYNSFWFTDTDNFPAPIACFEELIANSQVIDSLLQ